MSKGKLVPDEVMVSLIDEELAAMGNPVSLIFIYSKRGVCVCVCVCGWGEGIVFFKQIIVTQKLLFFFPIIIINKSF